MCGTPTSTPCALVAYLREEADFNRSWTDSRRGGPANPREKYVKRWLELAARSDGWADQVEALLVASPSPQGEAELAMRQKHGEVLQCIGTALGLLPGANLHIECTPAIRRLAEDSARYQWLHNSANLDAEPMMAMRSRPELDGAIDAARSTPATEKGE